MKNDSIHYSGLSFFNTIMIDGKSEMPSPFNTGNETGHSSFGVIRITVLYTNLCKTNTIKWRMDIFYTLCFHLYSNNLIKINN